MVVYQGPANGGAFFDQFVEVPMVISVLTYFTYMMLNLLGRLQDLLHYLHVFHCHLVSEPKRTKSFVPLYASYEAFYTRNLYRRIQDCLNRPICSAPGANMTLMDRESPDYGRTMRLTGGRTSVLNLGSYNYLGFGEPSAEALVAITEVTHRFGLGIASSRQEVGSLNLHRQLEELVAEFVGQEAAIVFTMGFATNSLNLPCLVDKNCCVVSDELNHTSLILGCRLTGAVVQRFKHNDMQDLERVLQEAVVFGQPRTHRPFKKILIVTEGVFSMEGSIVHLPEVIALKKKYRAYLYLDEAHSIGALGSHGRGAADYFGVNPRDIDISMGTFTKSFGSFGGYIAGCRRLIDYLRVTSYSAIYGGTMSAPIVQQTICSLRTVMGLEAPGLGYHRITQIADNTQYFRARLHKMGLIVYGNRDSPVVPVIICMPAKVIMFSRRCLQLGIGVVVVGFPATSLTTGRVRFCMSALHTREMLDRALEIIDQVAGELRIRFCSAPVPSWAEELLLSNQKKPSVPSNVKLQRFTPINGYHLVKDKRLCNGYSKKVLPICLADPLYEKKAQ